MTIYALQVAACSYFSFRAMQAWTIATWGLGPVPGWVTALLTMAMAAALAAAVICVLFTWRHAR